MHIKGEYSVGKRALKTQPVMARVVRSCMSTYWLCSLVGSLYAVSMYQTHKSTTYSLLRLETPQAAVPRPLDARATVDHR